MRKAVKLQEKKQVSLKDHSVRQRNVEDATRPFKFVIRNEHVKIARCGNPQECVIAQSVKDALGNLFEGIKVGASVTKMYTPGKVIRFSTPSILRKALIAFDKTGRWHLEPGEYTLNPPCKTAKLGARSNRWKRESTTKTGGGRDMFGGRALPTRNIGRL